MEQPPPPQPFRLLADEEFKALTTEGRVEYLKRAMALRNNINRQVDKFVVTILPDENPQ